MWSHIEPVVPAAARRRRPHGQGQFHGLREQDLVQRVSDLGRTLLEVRVGDEDAKRRGRARAEHSVTTPRRKRIADAGRKVRAAPRPNPIERRMSRFLREPPSIRTAASVIVIGDYGGRRRRRRPDPGAGPPRVRERLGRNVVVDSDGDDGRLWRRHAERRRRQARRRLRDAGRHRLLGDRDRRDHVDLRHARSSRTYSGCGCGRDGAGLASRGASGRARRRTSTVSSRCSAISAIDCRLD